MVPIASAEGEGFQCWVVQALAGYVLANMLVLGQQQCNIYFVSISNTGTGVGLAAGR